MAYQGRDFSPRSSLNYSFNNFFYRMCYIREMKAFFNWEIKYFKNNKLFITISVEISYPLVI